MKSNNAQKKVFFLLCVLSLGLFASCSSDDNEENTGRPGTEVISLVKKSLYKNGEVYANQLEDYQEKEYALVTDKAQDACTFYTALTGVNAPLGDSYEYTYEFTNAEGKACKIRIKGTKTPQEGLYATMYFNIPDCSEIAIVHVITSSLMNGTNSGEESTDIIKVPVMD